MDPYFKPALKKKDKGTKREREAEEEAVREDD